jgi:hypothetical protein
MEDFKERDIKLWTGDYNNLDLPSTAMPTLRQFLKTESSRVTRDQYRAMAVAQIAENEAEVVERVQLGARVAAQREMERQRERRWLEYAVRAGYDNYLRLEHAEIYNQDVERRLREEELSIRDIEGVDLRERARRYGQRRSLARQMLAEADAGGGWRGEQTKHKRPHKNNKSRSRKNRIKSYKNRKNNKNIILKSY